MMGLTARAVTTRRVVTASKPEHGGRGIVSTGRGSAGAGSGRVRNSDHERFDRRQNITSPGVKKLQVQDDASEREPLSWV